MPFRTAILLNPPFIFDDYHNIEQNSNIRIDDVSIRSICDAAVNNPTPRPIAYVSFAFNHYFGGVNVRGYHLVNLFIHGLNGVLVFLLSQLIFAKTAANDGRNWRVFYWMSISAALVFVLHPVQTQAVTYIVQRMTSLCTLFYLASVYAFFCGRLSSSIRNRNILWGIAFVFGVLAIGTKQMAITLPIAILLMDWVFFHSGELSLEKTVRKYGDYVVAIVVVVSVVAFLFKGTDLPKLFTRGFSRREFSLTERLMTEGRVMIHYVSLLLWPAPSRLSLVYDFSISKTIFDPITTAFSWALIITSIVLSFVFVNKCRMLCFAVLWFFLHLAVESTIIPLELVYETSVVFAVVWFLSCCMLLLLSFSSEKLAQACVGFRCNIAAGYVDSP